ncbi:Uncharacterized protein OBRU01_05771 [Operophtera brumata]|uniref:Uncharacterized protein n=1 Tax=Operophtera brumata TaxID=104452 RepID=A0A0L7LM27_OPEBR|nr:Uncharacterized protein OBRU01_05771 [Operophtera brumata]
MSAEFLERLKFLKHFGHTDRDSVRYVEVLRQYVQAPGFTSLEPNAEILNYDYLKFRPHMETAFSGLTFTLLKQSEAIKNNDPVHREALKKIPPSCATLFADEQFTALINKAGGVKNVFRPEYKGRMTSALRKIEMKSETVTYPDQGRIINSAEEEVAGKYNSGRNAELYKGRKTGSPSSHRERSGQYKTEDIDWRKPFRAGQLQNFTNGGKCTGLQSTL